MDNIESYGLKPEYLKILPLMMNQDYKSLAEVLIETLPALWSKEYKKKTDRKTGICVINHETFKYIFDDPPLEDPNINEDDLSKESRIVAVYGFSIPKKIKRDDYRLKGWIGKTEKIFGKSWDKGHFIAHSIGGAVDGIEINVFPQKRSINRGWSERGKIFRKMEKYCYEHSGVFCFNRPIYCDESFRPAFLEFGILMEDGGLWVELFDNR